MYSRQMLRPHFGKRPGDDNHRATRTPLAIAWLATLALALAACGSANPPASPNASGASSTGAEPSASPAPTGGSGDRPSPITTATPNVRPGRTLPPPAHRPQTIHVLEDPIAFYTNSVAGCTAAAGCAGDELNGNSRMLDAATHEKVGTFVVRCVLIDPDQNLYHCPANTVTLTGRGDIVFDETVSLDGHPFPEPWPIVSGTGEFLGATGSVESPDDSTWSWGDFVITITG